MQIDNSQLSPRTAVDHRDNDARTATSRPSVLSITAARLAIHLSGDEKSHLKDWITNHGSGLSNIRHGLDARAPEWLSNLGQRSQPANESHLARALEDIIEEIHNGVGAPGDAEDAFSNEDLLRDLVEMFARRRKPIGETQIGSHNDYSGMENPYAGALFCLWDHDALDTSPPEQNDESRWLFLQLVCVAAREHIQRLITLDDDTGAARACYNPDDLDLLLEIAAFMDQHPAHFGSPCTNAGQPITWVARVQTGAPLNASDAEMFALAIQHLERALRRICSTPPLCTARRRVIARDPDDLDFELSTSCSARNLLKLMCA
jgi:hypothetical protein